MVEEPQEVMSSLRLEIDRRVRFVTEYVSLGESHMVDFFVRDHWNTFVHPDAQAQLLDCDVDDLFSVKAMLEKYSFSESGKDSGSFAVANLATYFNSASASAIEQCHSCCEKGRIITDLKTLEAVVCDNCDEYVGLVNTKEYMCNKKSHEVEEMSCLVNSMSQHLGISRVLDIGSGKGYLGTHLSLHYGLEVTGVDCSQSNSFGALSRSQKLVKYWNAHLKSKTEIKVEESNMKYSAVTAYIDSECDLNQIFSISTEGSIGSKMPERVFLTGLHACGDLSSTVLRTFVKKPEIKAVCVVGCCYHLLTSNLGEMAENGFPMTNYLQEKKFTLQRNTRMLGLKALDRIKSTDRKTTEEKSSRSLFYRAVLSVILVKEFELDSSSKELCVGKEYSKSKDFIDYVRRCLCRLKVAEEKTESLTDDKITSYLLSMEPLQKTLLAFSMLREAFGPAVEALILLDKLLYLKEQEQLNNNISSYLVKLFDPVKSPRCYALVAFKE